MKSAIEETLSISDPTPTDMLSLLGLEYVRQPDWQLEDAVSDLTGLEYAVNLQALNLRLNRVSEITPLAGLTNLIHLDLSRNILISNLTPLSGLTYLQDLDLHQNNIDDISPLSTLTNLKQLILRWNNISDISALSTLSNLEYLSLIDNQIQDLSPLAGKTHLGFLDASKNQITNIETLSSVINLYFLSLSRNQISDVSALTPLVNIFRLYLNDNLVSDIQPLTEKKGLGILNLVHNPLNDEAYKTFLQEILVNNPYMTLTYDPNPRPASGVTASDSLYADKVQIKWPAIPNGPSYTTYYRVYRSLSLNDDRIPVSEWQTSLQFEDTTAVPGLNYTYWVQTATSAQGVNPGPYSQPVTGKINTNVILALSSSAGGNIISPTEGVHIYQPGDIVTITAKSIDPNLFIFSHWSGTAADSEQLSDVNWPDVNLVMDSAYTLRAQFKAVRSTLFVDNDAPGDPGPSDPNSSAPDENGTQEIPFDSIQEAIEVASDGFSIRVDSGTYYEHLDLLGKSIHLTAMALDDRDLGTYPVIDGMSSNTVISLISGENSNCMISGFVITNGKGQLAGAIMCKDSSPVIDHCLVVGNRALGPDGAAIYAINSQATFNHCTVVDNVGGFAGAGMSFLDSDSTILNSILWNNNPRDILSYLSSTIVSYTILEDDTSFDFDPFFARVGYWSTSADTDMPVDFSREDTVWQQGDYHLQSRTGRWNPMTEAWVTDDLTSPAIDAGDPASDWRLEPLPNGIRINQGAYGGTPQASRSEE